MKQFKTIFISVMSVTCLTIIGFEKLYSQPCSVSTDCNDSDPCTIDSCDFGNCLFLPLPIPSLIVDQDTTICSDEFILFTCVTCDPANFPFTWDLGDGVIDNFGDIFYSYSYSTPGTYQVIITETSPCGTGSDTITMQVGLDVILSPSNINCTNPTGCIDATVIGGTPPYTYQWIDVSTGDPVGGNDPEICNLGEGSYAVTVTDDNGCYFESEPIDIEDDQLVLTFREFDATCNNNNGSIDLVVTGNETVESYLWSNGETTQDISGLSPGTYFVTVTNTLLCEYSGSATIGNVSTLEGSVTHEDATCNECDGLITVTATSDNLPLTYNWSAPSMGYNPTTAQIQNACPGLFGVTVTDAAGCTIDFSVQLQEEDCPCDTPDVMFVVDDTLYCFDDTIHYIITSDVIPITGLFMDELGNIYPYLPDLLNINHTVGGEITVADGLDDYIFTPGLHQFCFVQLPFDDDYCESEPSCVQFRIDSCYDPCDTFDLNANFSWGKDLDADAEPNTYIFTNTSSIRNDLQFTFIEWMFSDGTTLTLAPPQILTNPLSHTFPEDEELPYFVCLTVSYIDPVTYYCCKDEYCVLIQPGPCDFLDLVAVVNSDPDPQDPNTVHFNAVAPSFPVEQYLWNFGDGNGGSGEFVSNTYDEDGYYDVCVTVLYHFSDAPYICCPATDCDEVCIGDPQQHFEYQLKCMNTQSGSAEGNDAMILSSTIDPDMDKTNFSEYECVMAHSMNTGLVFRSLIDFDLSSIEPDAKLQDAKLTLFNSMCSQHNHSGSGTVVLRRITSSWDEQTVSWENQPTTTEVNQISLSTSLLNEHEQTEIDIAPLVRDMLKARESSHGLMLLLQDESNPIGISFGSSDNFNASLRPKFDICYETKIATGISENNISDKIKVYPNPSTGLFNVELGRIPAQGCTLQVMDVSGRIVLELKDCNEYEILDLSKVDNGVYIIKVTSGNQEFLTKITKL